MVFLTAGAVAGLVVAGVTATASAATTIAQVGGLFDKDIDTPLTQQEREERARRAAAAASGGRASTVLTGGALTQRTAVSGSTTALLGG